MLTKLLTTADSDSLSFRSNVVQLLRKLKLGDHQNGFLFVFDITRGLIHSTGGIKMAINHPNHRDPKVAKGFHPKSETCFERGWGLRDQAWLFRSEVWFTTWDV